MKALGKFLASKYAPAKASNSANEQSVPAVKCGAIDEKTVFFMTERVLLDEYGRKGVSMIRPSFFRDGKLFLRSKSSSWAEEARMFRPELLERLARDLGDGVVKEIKISYEYGAQ